MAASILVIGCMFGAVSGGLQCHYLGRKKALIIDNLLVSGAYIGLSFSPTFVSLMICRFLLGISAASLTVNIPAYTSEICQPKIRMLTGSFVSVCISGGMTSMLVIGAILKWRNAVLAISVLPIVIIILVFLFVPESPIWLVMHNKIDEARQNQDKIRFERTQLNSQLLWYNTQNKLMYFYPVKVNSTQEDLS